MSHNYTPFNVWPAPPDGEGGGVTVHSQLTGRSSANGHPTSAITNLDATLALRQRTGAVPAVVPNGGTIPAGTATALCLGTTATLPDATTHGLGQTLYIAAIGSGPLVLSASGGDLVNFGSGITVAQNMLYGVSAQDLSALAPGVISWGVVSTNMVPAGVQALIDASAPTVDDLGFDVASDIEAAVEAVTTNPYDVPDPWDNNLSGFLLWLAIREQQGTEGLNGQGVISGQLARTIGAYGTSDEVDGGTELVINEGQAGRWFNLYTDEPAMDIVLGGTPDDSLVAWPNGTKLYFWKGNAAEYNFLGGAGDAFSVIQAPVGSIATMGPQYGVVTAVFRAATAEWILFGDLAPAP